MKMIDEKTFWAMKTMLNGGAKGTEVAEYFGFSVQTVCLVNKSSDLDEYHQKKAEKKAKQKKESEPVKTEVNRMVTIQGSHYIMEELRKQNELLTLISNKLAFIVEQLA